MDDALIFADDEFKIKRILNRIENICIKYGLILHKDKCKILVYNNDEAIGEINNIEVVPKIKYLGIIIENKRTIFQLQKAKIFESANKHANMMYSMLGKCCNRLLIGKTFWKGLVLPNILYGSDIIDFTIENIKALQVLDNRAYRDILKVPKYTATSFLRGEVGASAAETRIIKNKISFLKHAYQGDNELLKEIVQYDFEWKITKWSKCVHKCLNLLDLQLHQILSMSKPTIESKLIEWDDINWRTNADDTKTLKIYRTVVKR